MIACVFAAALVLAQIVGGEFEYTVQRGDSLTSLGARFGVSVRVLAEANDLNPTEILHVGKVLQIDNRHIVPRDTGPTVLVVNVPQLMLFVLGPDSPPEGYPVAAGRPSWRTPRGEFTVATKEIDPTWDVPVSIQEEMRRAGKPVLTHVPPSPSNPLGKYWIGLSIPGVGIHGTNVPSSIYSNATHGCIRLRPADIEKVFSQADVGMPGRILYEPVLVDFEAGMVFLEVHPDIYKLAPDPLRFVLDTAEADGFLDLLDLPRVEETIRRQDGIARDVTRR